MIVRPPRRPTLTGRRAPSDVAAPTPDFSEGRTSRSTVADVDVDGTRPVPLDFAPAYRSVASHASTCRDPADLAATMRDCGLDPDVVTIHDAADVTIPRGVAVSERAVKADLGATAVESATDLAADAIATGTATWHSGEPLRRAVALPFRDADGIFGGVTFGWVTGDTPAFSVAERGYLGALGPLAQRTAARLLHAPSPHPVAAILDTGYDPGLLLEPAHDDGGHVVDFVIAYASIDVPDVAGLTRVEQIGRRLLDAYPHLRSE